MQSVVVFPTLLGKPLPETSACSLETLKLLLLVMQALTGVAMTGVYGTWDFLGECSSTVTNQEVTLCVNFYLK